MNNFFHYLMRSVHHIIDKVGLNEGLQSRHDGLFPDIALDHLHHLFLNAFFSQI